MSVFLAAAGAVLFVIFYPRKEYIEIFTRKAEESLEKKVIITDLGYGLDGIILEGVSIFNGMSSSDELLCAADEVKIRFSLLPLLQKQLEIKDIIIDRLKVNIAFNNGRFNLQDLFKDTGPKPESSVKTSISDIILNEAEITLQNPPDYLKPLEGKYIFNGNINIINKKEIVISDSSIVLPEKRGTVSPEMKIRILDNDFEITSDVGLKNTDLTWTYLWGKDLKLPYQRITGTVKNLKITRSSVEGIVEGVSYLTSQKPLNVYGTCRVDIKKRLVLLSGVRGKMEYTSFLIKDLSFTTKGKILGFHVTDVDAGLNEMRMLLSFLPGELFGRVKGELSNNSGLYSGALNLIDVGYAKEAGLAGGINTEIIIKNNTFYKENIRARILDQPCLLSVATTDDGFGKIAVNMSADEFKFTLNRSKLPRLDDSDTKSNLQFSGRVDIGSLYFRDYQFQNFSANYIFADKNLTFNRIISRFMGGSINANGNADLRKGEPEVRMSVAFENIKVHDLANTFTEYKGRFFGIASGDADISLKIVKDQSIYDTLSGRIEFTIDKGKFVNTGIQKRLGVWLSELKYKLKDLEFNKIYGNLTTNNGEFNINSLICKAAEIELNLDGFFSNKEIKDLGDEKLPKNLKIVFRFQESFIKDLPSISRGAIILDSRLTKKESWYEARWPKL